MGFVCGINLPVWGRALSLTLSHGERGWVGRENPSDREAKNGWISVVAWVLPAELTYWFVLCPLPSPLPRGEGMGWRVNSKWQRSQKWLDFSILYPLSPWERVRERAVSASLLCGKRQSCRQPVEFHRLFTMPKDFVCAGMRQFLSASGKGRLKPV